MRTDTDRNRWQLKLLLVLAVAALDATHAAAEAP